MSLCCNIEDDNSELLHQTQAPGNSDMNRFHPQNKPKMALPYHRDFSKRVREAFKKIMTKHMENSIS